MSEPKLTKAQQAIKNRIQTHMDNIVAVVDSSDFDINEVVPALFMTLCGLYRKHGSSQEEYLQSAVSIWLQVNGHDTQVHPADVN